MIGPIVIFFSSTKEGKPFSEPTYNDSYKRLAGFAADRDIDLRFVFGVSNYRDGRFISYWKFEKNVLSKYTRSFLPELVIAHTREHPEFVRRLNNPLLEKICRDKYETFKAFPEYIKKTILLSMGNEGELAFLKTRLIVIKPRFGALGEDIHIISRESPEVQEFLDKGFIAQEFVDSKDGIPGLIGKRHELRLYILNGIIKAAYLRLPAKDSYLANIAKGATEKQIDMKNIPQEVIDMKNSIDNKVINIKPRLYTIDVMYEQGRSWVVELNDMPGMPDISVQPFTDNFLQSFLDLLKEPI